MVLKREENTKNVFISLDGATQPLAKLCPQEQKTSRRHSSKPLSTFGRCPRRRCPVSGNLAICRFLWVSETWLSNETQLSADSRFLSKPSFPSFPTSTYSAPAGLPSWLGRAGPGQEMDSCPQPRQTAPGLPALPALPVLPTLPALPTRGLLLFSPHQLLLTKFTGEELSLQKLLFICKQMTGRWAEGLFSPSERKLRSLGFMWHVQRI